MAIDSVKARHIRRAVNVVEFPLSRCVRKVQAVPARAPELSDAVCEDLDIRKRRVLDLLAAFREEEASCDRRQRMPSAGPSKRRIDRTTRSIDRATKSMAKAVKELDLAIAAIRAVVGLEELPSR